MADERDHQGFAPFSPEDVGRWLIRQWELLEQTEDLDVAHQMLRRAAKQIDLDLRELPAGTDPHDLAKSRWGVLAPSGRSEEVRRALGPLIRRREEQTGRAVPVLEVRRNESGSAFLERNEETYGTIDPEKLPYYLLTVADPDQIGFEFQYRLSLGRAVGRIGFSAPLTRADVEAGRSPHADAAWSRQLDEEGLQAYAKHVCDAEDGKNLTDQRAIELVAVDDDDELRAMKRAVVDPIAVALKRDFDDWPLRVTHGDDANREAFEWYLGGDATPALLFLSTHGRRKTRDDGLLQEFLMGAPAFQSHSVDRDDRLFTADDLGDGNLRGQIAVFFFCHSAGTPRLSDFPHVEDETSPAPAVRTRPEIWADRPFLAPLPQKMLRQGALAVVGHVERSWTISCAWPTNTQIIGASATLEDSLKMLVRGDRLGHAMRPLNRRYSQLGARVAQLKNFDRQGQTATKEDDLRELGWMWTALHDARNLIVLGDPAVYLGGQRQAPHTVQLDRELVQRIVERYRPEDFERVVNGLLRRSFEDENRDVFDV